MTDYAIGDIQGCYYSLRTLLKHIGFSPSRDKIWFAGDLVNRGPHSLKTCRFIMSLGTSAEVVLGNHDLAFLAVGYGLLPNKPHYTFQDILNAKDKNEILSWLRHQPLIHKHARALIVHAGVYPWWDLPTALKRAEEVQTTLQGPTYTDFLANLFGSTINRWDDSLTGWERLRFIVDTFTRMRYCTRQGFLNLNAKNAITVQSDGSVPWFEIPNPGLKSHPIVFGHWSTLQGLASQPHVHPIDTGCVWGGALTALQLNNFERHWVQQVEQDRLYRDRT